MSLSNPSKDGKTTVGTDARTNPKPRPRASAPAKGRGKQREPLEGALLAEMELPIGPYTWKLTLHQGFLKYSGGGPALGLTDADQQTLQLSAAVPPAKRWNVLWHEIAHAWHADLTLGWDRSLNSEQLSELVGLGMTMMTPATFQALHEFCTRKGLPL